MDNKQYIAEQRKKLADAQRKLQDARLKNRNRSQSELRKSDLRGRQVRQGIQGRIDKTTKEVKGSEVQFETEVAKKLPREAKPFYLDKEFTRVSDILNEKIANEQAKIDRYNQKIKSYSDDGIIDDRESDKIEEIEDDIALVRRRIKGYSRAKGDKATTIENVNSGYADKLANFEENKLRNRQQAKAEYRQALKSGALASTIESLKSSGFIKADDKNVTFGEYSQAVGKFNQKVKYENNLVEFAKSKGYENLSEGQKQNLIDRGLVTITSTEAPSQSNIRNVTIDNNFTPSNNQSNTFLSNLRQVPAVLFGIDDQYKENFGKIVNTTRTNFAIDKAQNFTETNLNKLNTKFNEFINPPTTDEIVISRQFDSINIQQENLNRRIEDFNLKYQGELSESQYNQALRESQNLQNLQQNIDLRRTNLESRQEGLRLQRESSSDTFVRNLIGGVGSTPLQLAGLGAGLFFSPVQTTKEQVKGIIDLPSNLVSNPATTSGTLIGSTLGNVAVGSLFGFGTTPKVRYTYSKPRVVVSKSGTKLYEVGVDNFGNKIYLTESQLTTMRYNSKTGNLIGKQDSKISGQIIVSSVDDSVKGGSVGRVQTFSNKAVTKGDGFVQIKGDLDFFRGSGSFSQIPDSELWLGNVKTSTRQGGTTRLRVGENGFFSQSYLRNPQQYQGLSNVKFKLLGQTDDASAGISALLTDSVKTQARVKGFTRSSGTKVSGYLRKDRRPLPQERDFGLDVSVVKNKNQGSQADSGYTILKPNTDGTKTSLSSTFDDVAKAQASADASAIASVLKDKASKPVKTKVETPRTPEIFTSTGLVSASEFYGKGQYETTQFGSETSGIKILSPEKENVKVFDKVIDNSKANNKIIQEFELESQEKPFFSEKEISLIKDISKTNTKQPQKQRQQQNLQLQQAQQLQLTQAIAILKPQLTRNPTRPQPPKKPNKIKTPKGDSVVKSLIKKVKEQPETFKALGRRFGKDIELGTFTSKKSAEKSLKSFLKGTLGASGKVLKDGQAVESNLLRDFEFRKSKADPFRIVQKSKFRLKKGDSQVKEINYFKNKSKKKKKRGSIL